MPQHKPPPPIDKDMRNEHLQTLINTAWHMARDHDARGAGVYAALDALEEKTLETWGFALFREGLERWDLQALRAGFALIRFQLR